MLVGMVETDPGPILLLGEDLGSESDEADAAGLGPTL